ncbi:MAG: AAA family ATPase [Myxococcota bacterium]
MSRLTPIFALVALLASFAGFAGAQPPGEGQADPAARAGPEGASKAPATTVDPRRVRARRIEAFIAGTLELAVDPADLFVIDLRDAAVVGPQGSRLLALLRAIGEPAAPVPAPTRRSRRAQPVPEPAMEPTGALDPAAELDRALRAYLRLSPSEREAAWATHARRQSAVVDEREASARSQRRLERITVHAERLEAFMAGTLELSIDPESLLRLDLNDRHEAALSESRRDTWPAGSAASPDARPSPTEASPTDAPARSEPEEQPDSDAKPETPTADEPDALTESLARAEARLDGLRREFLALSDSERAVLFTTHETRREQALKAEAEAQAAAEAAEVEAAKAAEEEAEALGEDAIQQISEAEAEADQAAVDREQALEAARRASTNANRTLAEERARLFSIKEAQARYEADINRRKSERIENHDRALEWSRRVDDLEQGTLFGARLEQEADLLYRTIRDDLSLARTRLRDELRRVSDAGAGVPLVGEGLDRDLPADVDRGDLSSLRLQLRDNEDALTQLEQEVAWELAQALRDDVVLLNRTRLALLELASTDLRGEVTGFGPEGIDQVRRELDQISVELGFHLLKLPHYKDLLVDRLRSSPIRVFVGAVQVLLVVLLVWAWRKNANTLVLRARRWLIRRPGRPRWTNTLSSGLWYFDRVRRPLELLLALWLLLGLAGNLDDLPELTLLWIVVRWVLLGLAVILLLDALAARQALFSREGVDTSALRIHSLRLVGMSVIVVGLLLGLTSAMVGQGAIYSWMLSTCWVLSGPVAIYLVIRWRPTIQERLGMLPEDNVFARWLRPRTDARIGFFAATVGAVILMVRGLGKWILRYASDLETTRRVLAYLFRREVTKRAAAASKAESVEPVDAHCYECFDPDEVDAPEVVEATQSELELVATLAETPRSTLSAIVAERGMGKTTFLRRLRQRVGSDDIKVVTCPEIGLEGLIPRIAALAGDSTLRGPQLAEALRRSSLRIVAIDDAHRLIQPAIRGLRELDDLIALTRQVGGKVSWVFAIGSPAWHYLERARGDRVFFEQVIDLPRWTERQLGGLIRKRCEVAKIDPSFEGLVVPSQVEQLGTPDAGRTESSYYRLLWDHSRGNPAVALHAFRESLFVEPDARTVVRLFKEPPATEIESLSLPLLFVLRAIVRLDLAREHEVVAATQLPPTDVSDALRFCQARGYIEPFDAGLRLSWHWYRTITTVLQRQHLLSTP